MKKSEILRGRELFKRIALTGKRVDARRIRCTYILRRGSVARFQIGFKVPAKNFNAVRRNRICRLMREAFSQERAYLSNSLSSASTELGMIAVYKGKESAAGERITLAEIQQDANMICRSIISSLEVKTK